MTVYTILGSAIVPTVPTTSSCVSYVRQIVPDVHEAENFNDV